MNTSNNNIDTIQKGLQHQSSVQVTALDVAEYFLWRVGKEKRFFTKEKKTLTNKKLQKLVYYAQVWSLALNDERLFPEKIEAWVHGPVVPSLYDRFKRFGFGPISDEFSDPSNRFSEEQLQLLEEVWRVYGKYDAGYLEMLTHSEAPWQEAREGLSEIDPSHNEIDLSLAKAFYIEKNEERKKDT